MTKRETVFFTDDEAYERLKQNKNVITVDEPYKAITFNNPVGQKHNPRKARTVRSANKNTVETGIWKCYPKDNKRKEAIEWLNDTGFTIAKRLPHCIGVYDVESLARMEEVIMSSGLFVLVEADEIFTVLNNAITTNDQVQPGTDWGKDEVEFCWGKVPQMKYGNVHVIEGSGMDVTHPDLFGNVAGTWNGTNSTTDIMPVNPANEKHPYMVAGIPCAVNNNSLGIANMSGNRFDLYMHQCGWNTTSGGSFSMSGLSLESCLAKVLTDPLALVVTMSFGGGAKYPGVQIAIDRLRTLGRGGKGIPVFASSGNNGLTQFTQYPACYTGVMAIGAVSFGGTKLAYSNAGSKLFAAAQTGIHTLDAVGSLGYKPGDINLSGNGTSASSPNAARKAAMLLAYKPELTELDVRRCIMESSEKSIYTFDANGRCDQTGYGFMQMGRMLKWADGQGVQVPQHNYTCIISAPTTANAGQVISITVTAKENPAMPASTPVVRLYDSSNNVIDAADTVIANLTFNLGNGVGEQTKQISYTVPARFNTRTIIAKIDPDGLLTESNENDNQYSVNMFVPEPPPLPGTDIAVIDPRAYRAVKEIQGVPTDAIWIEYQMKNTGTQPITSLAFAKELDPVLAAAPLRNYSLGVGKTSGRSTERMIGNPASPKVYCQVQKVNGGIVNHQIIELTVTQG